jgi:Zn finger protein HypA/HybF involved in hydrogenase expression
MKVHVITYECEQCGATQTAEAGTSSEGMCPKCGSPMKIDDLFSDRRIALLPVDADRRHHAA